MNYLWVPDELNWAGREDLDSDPGGGIRQQGRARKHPRRTPLCPPPRGRRLARLCGGESDGFGLNEG